MEQQTEVKDNEYTSAVTTNGPASIFLQSPKGRKDKPLIMAENPRGEVKLYPDMRLTQR